MRILSLANGVNDLNCREEEGQDRVKQRNTL